MYPVNLFSVIAKTCTNAIYKGSKINIIYPSRKPANPDTNVAFKTITDKIIVRINTGILRIFLFLIQ